MSVVTLTTDFGLADPFVGIMKGVIATRAPEARVIDVTHGIPPQDLVAGALALRHAVPWFPEGTIHVAVVDPGVGTARRALCVETSRGVLVGPDNGVLSLAAPPDDVHAIVHLTDERFFLSPRSATFHGRDVFAPIAAALATGTPPRVLGTLVGDMARVEIPAPVRDGRSLRGQVIHVDGFGNLATNVPGELVAGRRATIAIGDARLGGLAGAYGEVAPGEPVAVVNSWGVVEIAVRNGSARERLGARVGDAVLIELA